MGYENVGDAEGAEDRCRSNDKFSLSSSSRLSSIRFDIFLEYLKPVETFKITCSKVVYLRLIIAWEVGTTVEAQRMMHSQRYIVYTRIHTDASPTTNFPTRASTRLAVFFCSRCCLGLLAATCRLGRFETLRDFPRNAVAHASSSTCGRSDRSSFSSALYYHNHHGYRHRNGNRVQYQRNIDRDRAS